MVSCNQVGGWLRASTEVPNEPLLFHHGYIYKSVSLRPPSGSLRGLVTICAKCGGVGDYLERRSDGGYRQRDRKRIGVFSPRRVAS